MRKQTQKEAKDGKEVRLKATDEVLKETSLWSKTALVCPDQYGSDTDSVDAPGEHVPP